MLIIFIAGFVLTVLEGKWTVSKKNATRFLQKESSREAEQ